MTSGNSLNIITENINGIQSFEKRLKLIEE